MAFSTTPDWFHISDEDDIVWESRPHPVSMGVGLPVGVGFALLGLVLAGWTAGDSVALTVVGLLLAVGGTALAGVRYLFWTNTRYVITTAELYKKHGVVSRDVTQFRLDRVQNTSLSQTVVGRALGYGDLTVYTAGSGDPEITFERVPNPERASRHLSDQLGEFSDDESVV
ncbi:PH domain-containing protein [Natronolimnohabitans innermongolicus]|uniref:Membrane-flanked domain-containing protein n=1 Tax=Natronolimnohabitans innermongolicus JCM 12255 TaxID=1227499 RepID=L9X1J9_9EURY|nr:PH domain-containing protein [Natronolimnohabitans innermongolicus]ELY54463.1 membrane-flanked domain-containing protein [Natronolimnohabitans innermongolicus JCM 12255]